ncbi:Sec34-like family-domain-containing protein [Obelidium mucronatum]|nr:Sec34-like family-domain-containing protein [Obelidium mucronatum]
MQQRSAKAENSALSVSSVERPPSSAPNSSNNNNTTACKSDSLASTSDFLAWFAQVEREIEAQHAQRYWTHVAALEARAADCKALLAATRAAAALVAAEQTHFAFVAGKTAQLQTECEALLAEQQALEALAQDLQDRLLKFNVLEPVVRLFNGTGVDGVVLDTEFVPMLARLDDSLAFVEAHSQYKDADLYRMKFRQCITRGLSLIKMYFVNAMRSLGDEITRQLHDATSSTSQSLQTALFYAKFKTTADGGGLRALIAEIEARIPSHPEYHGLLGECLNAYFTVRESLVKSGVEKVVDGLLQESTDVLQVAKNGAAYIMSLSADECALFNHYFVRGDAELIQYLDRLSVSLYDHLRPRIVREQRIDILADLCRSLYLHLESVESLTSTTAVGSVPDSKLAEGSGAPVKYVVGKILEDAQERLAFRAAEYNTSPTSSDIRSPVLPPRTASTASIMSESQEEQVAKTISAGKLVYGSGEWYPTLHKSLYILGKLYRAVPKPIFEDLAQEAIDLCRKSMISASEIIATKNTRLDGQFFLIKNLLMLREQIAPFDSTKWGISTLPTLGLTFLTTQLPSLMIPTLIQQVSKDSKLSVNLSLKQTCEEMILDTVKACVEPVSSFMIKVTAFRLKAVKTDARDKLGMQAFASPQKCVECSNLFAASVQTKIGAVVAKMGDYLGDKRTEAVLLLHIKGNIVESYTSFHAVVVAEHSNLVLEGLLSVEDVSALVDVCCAQNMRLV